MEEGKRLLTQSGYEKLQSELEELKVNARKEIAEKMDDGSINIGSRVTIREIDTGFDMDIDIVGASEANSLKGRISNESPVGKALMHKTAGETVIVDTPEGEVRYEIMKVEHSVA